MTGYTGTMTGSSNKYIYIHPSSGTRTCKLAGTWTSWPGLAIESVGVSTTINFTSAGKTPNTITNAFTGDGTGIISQQDAITCVVLSGGKGTWNTNGNTITTTGLFSLSNTLWDCTNSTINCSAGFDGTSTATPVFTGSTINFSGAENFTGGGKTYGTLNFSANGKTIIGNNTFGTLAVNTAGQATGLKFAAGSVTTVTNFATNGYALNLAKILSDTAGTHFHLTTASTLISVDYMSITDSVADQANTWYAGANSTSVSGNSGWVFTAPPKAYSRETNAALKTDDATLTTVFTNADYTLVSSDNDQYVSQDISAAYATFLFKDQYASQVAIVVQWQGQSSLAPSDSVVKLQIWDRIGTTWIDVDTENGVAANIDFELTGIISADLDHYYDASGWVACRVYQAKV
jgi:hypothetical protein